MQQLADVDALREFEDATPDDEPDEDPESQATFRRELIEWLDGAGLDTDGARDLGGRRLEGLDGHSLVVCGRDTECEVYLFALPDSELSEPVRAALAAVNGATFEPLFFGDLEPGAWAAALRVLCGLSIDALDVLGQLDEYLAELDRRGVPAPKRAELRELIGAWDPFSVEDGDGLNHRFTHLYTVWLAG